MVTGNRQGMTDAAWRVGWVLATALALAAAAGQAWGVPVISPIIDTTMPAGTYSFPIAPVLDAGKTRSDTCYQHSTHTSNTTGASNIALCSATYRWTLSPAGSSQDASIQVYYLELAAGGDPSIAAPTSVSVDGILWYPMTCGAMDPGSYCYGNVDTLGFNTIYIAMLNMAIADPDDGSYPDDTVTACYGQGAKTKKYCASGAYDNGTGALTCADNFLLYGFTSGDRILIEHASINSGIPTWTTVSSKTDKDGVVVATGLSASPIGSGVKIYSHFNPFMDGRFFWEFPDSLYSYVNPDSREDAASAAIATLTWHRGIAAPVMESNGTGTRDEDYSLTVYDDFNGLVSTPLTGTYSDDFWPGARHIYIDATLGTDCGSCTSALCGSACTLVAPCQTWACGISQLTRTASAAVLHVKRGETFNLSADVNFVGGHSQRKFIDGASYGSGADPIIETAPTTTEYIGLGGTTTNLAMRDIRFARTGTCSGGCADLVSFTANNAVIYRNYFESGGGQATVDLDGVGLAYLDNFSECGGTGMQYALFSMGGDALTAYSVRLRAFIGFIAEANNCSDAIVRMRGHQTLVAASRSEVIADATNQVSPTLRFALDNHPHYQVIVADNKLKRISGSTSPVLTSLPQSGGRFDYFRVEGNEMIGDGANSEGYDSSGSGIGRVAFRNNSIKEVRRAIDVFAGEDLDVSGNTMYSASTSAVHFIDSSGSTGYVNLWSINNVVSAPNCNSSARGVLNDGANAAKARTHIHKTLFNYGNSVTGGMIRVASDNDTVADYEAARPGLDVIGGSSGAGVDPLFASVPLDLRLCTAAGVPDASCSGASPCVATGHAYGVLYYAYPGNARTGHEIGAFDDSSSAASGIHPALLHYYFLNQRR